MMEIMAYWNVTCIFKFVYWSWEKCVCVCVFWGGCCSVQERFINVVFEPQGEKSSFIQVELSKLRKYKVLVQESISSKN